MRKDNGVRKRSYRLSAAASFATPDDIRGFRKEWEQAVNRAYEREGFDIRVDHRSHKERGLDQEPQKHLGPEATGHGTEGSRHRIGRANREIMARNAAREAVRALEKEAQAISAEIIDLQAARAMREAREAAKGRTDEIIPDRAAEIDRQAELSMQTARAAAAGRRDEIRPHRYAEIDRPPNRPCRRHGQRRQAGRTTFARHREKRSIRNTREPTPPPKVAPEFARETVQPEIKPLGQTAGEIRLAWQLTATADQFAQALEDKGLILVHISREEAEASHRAHAFAAAIDRQSRELREGFAVVDQRGNVTRIDQRTTGDQLEEIQKRLGGGIDRDELVSVADAKEVMRQANQAARA